MTILCDNSFLLNISSEHILIRKKDLEVMPYKALTVSGKTCFLKKGRPAGSRYEHMREPRQLSQLHYDISNPKMT